MERLHAWALCGALLASCGAASAADASLNSFSNKTIAALVKVDANGKVTSVDTATRLPPQMDRLLRANLQEMIAEPATYKGKPTSSQFLARLAVDSQPVSDGQVAVNFTMASTSPLPMGRWHWVRVDGTHMGLANSDRTIFNEDTRVEPGPGPVRTVAMSSSSKDR